MIWQMKYFITAYFINRIVYRCRRAKTQCCRGILQPMFL